MVQIAVYKAKRAFMVWLGMVFTGLLLAPWATAQSPPNTAQGLPELGSFQASDIDVVNLNNGNLTVQSRLMSFPQRGGKLDLSYSLQYNNKSFFLRCVNIDPSADCGGYVWDVTPTMSVGITDSQSIRLKSTIMLVAANTWDVQHEVTSPDGATHAIGNLHTTRCPNPLCSGASGRALDGSGWLVQDDNSAYDSNGVRHFVYTQLTASQVYAQDPNGNQLLLDGKGNIVDTVGRTLPSSRGATTDFTGCLGPLPVDSAFLSVFPGPDGTDAPIKACNVNIPVKTNFNYVGQELVLPHPQPPPFPTSPHLMLQSIVLPNGKAWTFEYDSRDPGDTLDINYGDLTKVTFPTGGTLSYTWKNVKFPGCQMITAVSRSLASRTLDANDGTGPRTWQYDYVVDPSNFDVVTTVLDPEGNKSVHTFVGGCYSHESKIEYFDSTGTLLKTVTKEYDPIFVTRPQSFIFGEGVVLRRTTTLWPNGQSAIVDNNYTTTFSGQTLAGSPFTARLGIPSDTYEYDYSADASTPGPLLHHTHVDYAFQNNSSYLSANLLNLPASIVKQDAGGNQCAKVDYGYDDPSGLTASSALFQHATPSNNVRGNLSSTTHWLTSTPCQPAASWSPVNSFTNMYDTGEVYQSVDPLGQTTTFSYDAAFSGAYITQTQLPDTTGGGTTTHHITQSSYDFNTGLRTSLTDENGKVTSYFYDNMRRLTEIDHPDGGKTSYDYHGDAQPFTVTRTALADPNPSIVTTAVYDGMGRLMQALQFDGAGNTPWISTDTYYDGLGRVKQVSNPYRVANATAGRAPCGPCTSTSYDGLNRVIAVTTPDNAQVRTDYVGDTTTVTDQAKKTRSIRSDAVGRTLAVVENPTNVNGESSSTTSYSYNVLDNLVSVTQGVQQRFFLHDSLGRLVRERSVEEDSNPGLALADAITQNSQWSTAYDYYDNGSLKTKTDARGIVASVVYDELNREVSRNYQNDPANTPAVTRSWDGAGAVSPVTNAIGRLTAIMSSAGSYTYDSYSAVGQVLQSTETIDNQPFVMQYAYDLAGHAISQTYPSGRVVTSGYDAAGRINGIAGQVNSNGTLGTPAPYADSILYDAHGGMTDLRLGNKLWEHTNYDPNRFQTTEIGVGTLQGSSDLLKLNYDYGADQNNGNVVRHLITAPTTPTGQMVVTQLARYDAFNRLQKVQEVNGDVPIWQSTAIWEQDLNYDIYGNRTGVSATVGLPTFSTAATIDSTTNRYMESDGFQYDPAGNLIQEPIDSNTQNAYIYNAENHLITAQQNGAPLATYQYDGLGRRVKKTVGAQTTTYIYSADGILIAEYSNAALGAPGTQYLSHDNLGSTRLITAADKSVTARYDLMPFGELIPPAFAQRSSVVGYGPLGNIAQLFTGKERDTETTLDYFGFRYFSGAKGRWTSPDQPFADQQPEDPQSWNMYAYVRNNPLTNTDPDGRDCLQGWSSCFNYILGGLKAVGNLPSDIVNAPNRLSNVIISPFTNFRFADLVPPSFAADGIDQKQGMEAASVMMLFVPAAGELAAPKIASTGAKELGAFARVEEAMSARAAIYQSKITGTLPEVNYIVDGVKFDGFVKGTLLDAKGPGYAKFVKNGEFMPWFEGADGMVSQAQRQLAVAGGKPIEWHFAEEAAANAARNLLKKNKITGINIIFDPQ